VPGSVSTPWWEVIELREEIRDTSGAVDDVAVSLYGVVYEKGARKPPYASADYYGQITHPTNQLVELLTQVAIRLSDNAGHASSAALVRLDQGMGGGKSHACIGAWHLATDPVTLAKRDIGHDVFEQAERALGRKLPKDLDRPQVVVLSCDNMSPGATDPDQDGPWAYNLYERFLWRLFDGLADQDARFESFRRHFASKAKIGDAILSLDRPVLIIIDEILNYVGDGLDGKGDTQLTAQDMAFLRALSETVTTVPRTFMLVVMINSEKDATTLTKEGEARREDLQAYLQRNGQTTSVNENADFTAILRRRLFTHEPAAQAVAEATAALQQVMNQGNWKTRVFGVLNAQWTARFAEETARTYPFHPQLMQLAEHEWANLAGFQEVRSTIRIFAATAHALALRGKSGEWAPLLIGPGDLPLSDAKVRDAVVGSGLISDTKTAGNYRSIAQSDIVDLEDRTGAARQLDLARTAPWATANPRAAERAATMIYLTSIVGARAGSKRGAADPEVKAATVVPDASYDYAEADVVVRDLTDADESGLATVEVLPGRGGQPPRYYLSTRQRLPMLVRAMRNTVTDLERDRIIARRVAHLLSKEPFETCLFVEADHTRSHRAILVEAGLDQARTTRLIALDPAMFTLRNGTEKPTLDAVTAVLGLGPNKVPVEWASSAVFAIAGARGRVQARRVAAEYLAYERVLAGPEVQEDVDMLTKATSESNDALARLDSAVRRAFQHVLYLAHPDPTLEREVGQLSLEQNQSALDGRTVWGALVEGQKAFAQGDFTATALVFNLRESDYGRPLSEVRDAFWNTPRLGLLPGGQSDLRQAIYDAVQSSQLRVVRGNDDADVAVTAPAEINFNAAGHWLAKPRPLVQPGDEQPGTDEREEEGPIRPGSSVVVRKTGGQPDRTTAIEQQVGFTVIHNLTTDPDVSAKLAQLFRRLFDVLDRGSASYLQATLQIHLPSAQAQELVQLAESLGIKITIRDR
jgi:hypothetical protein